MKLTGKHKGYFKESQDKPEFVELQTIENELNGIIVDFSQTRMKTLKGIIEDNKIKGNYIELTGESGKFEFEKIESQLIGHIEINGEPKEYTINLIKSEPEKPKLNKVSVNKNKKRKSKSK